MRVLKEIAAKFLIRRDQENILPPDIRTRLAGLRTNRSGGLFDGESPWAEITGIMALDLFECPLLRS